ncbi:hypothetical protein [Pedobacter sp. Hv1]|uniref:hypothetical protein n=1 Tax=Pedobacter sp. Hv1 TaxID=1740090 RepID=UPI0006D89178|nr:hypothetical protein [Pedobacter sp. Hv1]KQB99233.1 hypothetical protein AQF98_16790 [Pedobacter sp. Hv1]
MKPWLIVFKRLPANAMALFPFILIKKQEQKNDPVLINHEKIHLRQQLEMLILPFYVFYLLNYFINLLRYRNHDRAYFNISFEREAYHYEADLNYLSERKWLKWIAFL